jgi:hypothetical protein
MQRQVRPREVCFSDANAHVWAHVVAWLADPTDASAVRAFRASCTVGVLGFDIAVHAGWVALAAHVSTGLSTSAEH